MKFPIQNRESKPGKARNKREIKPIKVGLEKGSSPYYFSPDKRDGKGACIDAGKSCLIAYVMDTFTLC